MTLTLPPELADLVARAGGRWPQADEDQLHALAGSWRSLAGEIGGLKDSGQTIGWQVAGLHEGASIDAFADVWEEFERQLDTAQNAANSAADGIDAMAKAVLATKQTIAEAAAETFRQILELRRRASLSGGIWCIVGRVIVWLLSKFGKYIVRALVWLFRWIGRFIAGLFKKIWAAIVAVINWFKKLFKGKKQPPKKQQPKKDGWSGGKPPKEAQDKVPKEWGGGTPTKKAVKDPSKQGWRWKDPKNENTGIRIDKGDPNSPNPSQRVDHVVINNNGKVIGRDGRPVGRISDDPERAHIPLDEWLRWQSWNHP
ncbi:MAG: WXG100 family type VII secretion target [Actinomadura sp.]